MSVYFSSIKINKSEYAVPSKAGWWEGRKLRFIHSFRPKPAGTDDDLCYQSEILAEHSNDVLKILSNGKLNVEANFISNNNTVRIKTELVSDSRDLRSVNFESTKTRWEWYEDCFSFFYPGSRIYTAPTVCGYHDIQDDTRGEGWFGRQNINLMQAYEIVKTFDYMLLGQKRNEIEGKEVHLETKERAEQFFESFKNARTPLRFKYLGNLNWAFYVAGRLFDDLSFKLRETISFSLDFYMRLVAIRGNFDTSAICLIENSQNLNSELLTELFPNVQFIAD